MLPSRSLGPMAATGLTGSVWQMNPSFWFRRWLGSWPPGLVGEWRRRFRKGWPRRRRQSEAVLAVISVTEHTTPRSLDRLRHRTRKGVSSCRKNMIR
jgi:hypothetical protein